MRDISSSIKIADIYNGGHVNDTNASNKLVASSIQTTRVGTSQSYWLRELAYDIRWVHVTRDGFSNVYEPKHGYAVRPFILQEMAVVLVNGLKQSEPVHNLRLLVVMELLQMGMLLRLLL